MKLKFTKMEGAGNDFVVLDCSSSAFSLSALQIKSISDRHFGVGCDQLLVVEKPTAPGVDFRYRIFNADGGEVEQCGNGARCFVKFVHQRGLTAKRDIRVQTLAGVIAPRLEDDGEVSVDMGPPRLEALTELLAVDGSQVELAVLSMGNPHAVQVVADVTRAPVTTQGPKLEHHARFPNRVNAGYMQVLDRQRIALRVRRSPVGPAPAPRW
jgi:diaminopimelate epimerase